MAGNTTRYEFIVEYCDGDLYWDNIEHCICVQRDGPPIIAPQALLRDVLRSALNVMDKLETSLEEWRETTI